MNLGGPGSSQADNRTAHSRPGVTVVERPEDGDSQDQWRGLQDIAEETTDTQCAKGKYNVVTGTLSRPSTLHPEQPEECLQITQKIRDATKRNETNSENIERDIRVENLLLPRNAVTETDRMVPDVSSAAGTLVEAREKPANVRNECEWVREWQTEKSPNRTNATQPKPDKKRVANLTDGGWRAVVPPNRRRQELTESIGFHITTRKMQRKERPNGFDGRKHKKQSQKTRDKRRSWGVKTPWKWRGPRT